jgi:hypothetical protein
MAAAVSLSPSTAIPSCRSGFQLVPEFHVSQNGERDQVLRLIQAQFGGCGYIKPNGRKDRPLVLVVRKREDLLRHVIPFFERSPLLSSKQQEFEFERFAHIVRAMALGRHRTLSGFNELLGEALAMNGGGRHRRVRWMELFGGLPESSETGRQTGDCSPEDTVRAAWRHAEPGRNALALDRQQDGRE